jgi:hypothetical protein
MCQFNISFSTDAESLTSRAKQEIARAGGALTGDSTQGNFSLNTPIGSIEGNYLIDGQVISISITKKPFLLSCQRIEKELIGVMR